MNGGDFLIAMSKLRGHLLTMLREAIPVLPPEDLAALFEGAALEIHASCAIQGRPFDQLRYMEGIPYGQQIMKGIIYELLRREADG